MSKRAGNAIRLHYSSLLEKLWDGVRSGPSTEAAVGLGSNRAGSRREKLMPTYQELMPVMAVMVFIVVFSLAAMIPWFFIYKKAGYHPAMGCLMFVPIVNLVMMFVLAFSEWPIERDLRNLRVSSMRSG
jgi:hypothetical protein